MEIINIKDKLGEKCKKLKHKEFNILKEQMDRILFYNRNSINEIKLLEYLKNTEKVNCLVNIKTNADPTYQWVNLDYVDENTENIYYTIRGRGKLTFYRYDIYGDYKEILFDGNYHEQYFIDMEYVIYVNNDTKSGAYLYDFLEGKIYKIKDNKFYNTKYDNTRVVHMNNAKYLVHNKYYLDLFHFEQIRKESNYKDKLKTGIYVIEFNKFIEQVKNGDNKLDWDFKLESGDNEYIESVKYNKVYSGYLSKNMYHFTITNIIKKNISLYEFTLNEESEIDLIKIVSISYREYDDTYRLNTSEYPVNIYKYTTNIDKKIEETRVFYPDDHRVVLPLNNREKVLNIVENRIISKTREKKSGVFKEYIIIRDKDTLEVLNKVEGQGYLSLKKNKIYLF